MGKNVIFSAVPFVPAVTTANDDVRAFVCGWSGFSERAERAVRAQAGCLRSSAAAVLIELLL